MLDRNSPPEYLVGHLEEALARDPRIAEPGVRVHLGGPPLSVVLEGTVAAVGHKAVLTEIVHELLPGAEVRDETTVADYPETDAVEQVP